MTTSPPLLCSKSSSSTHHGISAILCHFNFKSGNPQSQPADGVVPALIAPPQLTTPPSPPIQAIAPSKPSPCSDRSTPLDPRREPVISLTPASPSHQPCARPSGHRSLWRNNERNERGRKRA
ncbi:hypothetical protein M0R45_002417 [Rubus argutus]|uniref:Uncharacterized protein n=1 Tax=Rubus argutus TaxID=59490 RepID=A0AAW1VRK8_RUBAR